MHASGPGASLAGVRNRAAARARTSHLIFLDADDELDPAYVDAMRTALTMLGSPALEEGGRPQFEPRPSLLVPRVQKVVDGAEDGPPSFPNRQQAMDRLNHCVIGTAVPRLLFRAVGGFRDDLPIYEDWALFLACQRAGARLVDVPGAVYRAHDYGGRRNSGDRRLAAQTYDRIRSEHLALRG